jgi:hypothetical protein
VSNANAGGGGIGLSTLLGVLFIGLKLGGLIDWSWWWVLSPFWIPAAILTAIVLALLLTAGVCLAIAAVLK